MSEEGIKECGDDIENFNQLIDTTGSFFKVMYPQVTKMKNAVLKFCNKWKKQD